MSAPARPAEPAGKRGEREQERDRVVVPGRGRVRAVHRGGAGHREVADQVHLREAHRSHPVGRRAPPQAG